MHRRDLSSPQEAGHGPFLMAVILFDGRYYVFYLLSFIDINDNVNRCNIHVCIIYIILKLM